MKTIYLYAFFIFLTLSLSNCRPTVKWSFEREFSLTNIKPVGIAITENQIWISDVLNNRIITFDLDGNQLHEYTDFKRPMHISNDGLKIYVPEYLSDKIKIIEKDKVDSIKIDIKLDAPAGIAVHNNMIAIADFFNHRIILKDRDNTIVLGEKGHGKGKLLSSINTHLDHPTDLVIEKDTMYVINHGSASISVFRL